MKVDGYDPELLKNPNEPAETIVKNQSFNNVGTCKRLNKYFKMIKWVNKFKSIFHH